MNVPIFSTDPVALKGLGGRNSSDFSIGYGSCSGTKE